MIVSLRAAFWMTSANVVRLLREGLVLRSMIFPGIVTTTTLAATLGVLAWSAPGRTVLVTPDTPVEVTRALERKDFRVRVAPDAAERVRSRSATLATDGRTLWVHGTPPAALEIEAVLRSRANVGAVDPLDARGPGWSPVPPERPRPRDGGGAVEPDLVCRVVGLLFALYGIVFGLGGVARDRDAGILEAELALPVGRWVGGFARWVSSSIVLCSFYTLTVVLLGALLPLARPESVLTHGWAASCASVAIGIGVVGTSGLRQSFSGPFALGMTLATALGGAGASLGLHFLPLGSLLSREPGWTSLGLSLVFGLVASALYGRRNGGGR